MYPDLSSSYLSDLESLLVQHPRAIVGEIGLCKVAKFVRQYPADLGGKSTAMEMLEAEIKADEIVGIVPMTGSVLAAGIEHTHAGDPRPGWMQQDEGIQEERYALE